MKLVSFFELNPKVGDFIIAYNNGDPTDDYGIWQYVGNNKIKNILYKSVQLEYCGRIFNMSELLNWNPHECVWSTDSQDSIKQIIDTVKAEIL